MSRPCAQLPTLIRSAVGFGGHGSICKGDYCRCALGDCCCYTLQATSVTHPASRQTNISQTAATTPSSRGHTLPPWIIAALNGQPIQRSSGESGTCCTAAAHVLHLQQLRGRTPAGLPVLTGGFLSLIHTHGLKLTSYLLLAACRNCADIAIQ